MASRRDKKKNSRVQNEAKRRSLLELGPAVDPRGEPATNPVMLLTRPTRKTSLPPAPPEPMADTSLASLALATRRGAADLMERMSTNRPLSDYPPRPSAPPPPPPPAAAAEYQPPSVAPPPVQVPSEPPRAPRRRDGNLWLRTLGIIVLSASVGAVVSSVTSEVKDQLKPVALHDMTVEGHRASAATPLCTTAAQALDAKPILASASLGISESSPGATPRISVNALPLQQGSRREAFVDRRRETSSENRDDSASSESRRETSVEPRRESAAPQKVNLDGPVQKSKRSVAPPAPPPPRELPDQPSRTEVTNAVRRAASGAASCDSGPQDGIVTVTFAPSGAVQSVSLVKGFGDATLNACVLRAFGRARVPAFSGEPVKVRKTLNW